MRWSNFLLAAVASLLCTAANSTIIQSTYTHLSGVSWSAQLVVTNNGDPDPINEFSVYFSESLFSNLAVGSAPAAWDSIVIQPDPGIPAPGYLDAVAVDPLDSLATGQSQAGFIVNFHYLGHGNPGQLGFDAFGEGFVWMSSGFTSVVISSVPEPTSLALFALGTLVCAGAIRRKTSH